MKTKISFKDTVAVKAIREKTGLGIDSFASLLGVTRRTIELWETGARKLSSTARNFLLAMNKHPVLIKQAILDTITIGDEDSSGGYDFIAGAQIKKDEFIYVSDNGKLYPYQKLTHRTKEEEIMVRGKPTYPPISKK